MKLGIIDYDAGNLTSVETAVRYTGADYTVGRYPEELKTADRIIFPGVGEASSAMSTLRKRGLDQFLNEFSASGKPLLAICIGSQIILGESEEGNTECLGLIPGKTRLFPADTGQKIPHMGWNQVRLLKPHPVFEGVPDNSSFYFVHSYYTDPADKEVSLAITDYGMSFTSAMSRDNITATQFHPEKSGPYGLRVLNNFINYKG